MLPYLVATGVMSSVLTLFAILAWALKNRKRGDMRVNKEGYVEFTKSREDYRLAGGIEVTYQPNDGGDPIVWKNVRRSSEIPQPYLELMRRKFQGQYDMFQIIYKDDDERTEPASPGPVRGWQ